MPGLMARGLEQLQVAKEGLHAGVAGADVRPDGGEDDVASHRTALILIPDGEMRVDPNLQGIFFEEPGAEGVDG